ncbi:MAG TPA: cytochrome c biogenesis protein CcdA, partial [Candidatus Binatia bacterium]|nr:cytochrome c biogenesis protein CcdA [Candidatus Binatia bacterium]
MNYSKVSNLILRYGLALTYLFSGYDLIAHPRSWSSFVPYWMESLLPVDVLTYIQFQGAVEILLALAFISGFLLRPAAFISAVEMVGILLLYGIDAVTFRDLAILGGSLAVFFATFSPSAQKTAVAAAENTPATPPTAKTISDSQKRLRIILVSVAFVLFSIILIGLFWLSNTTKDQAGWLAFSYATGLSMIVLPCTLPLAFVIVPLAMGKDAKKGLAIAFAFAVGVTLTLSMYGALIAKLGEVVGLDRAKDTMYLIAGIFAVVFGFGELGLIKLRVPTYAGAFPKFIQDRKDWLKGLLLGLLLGNVGLGCPNPAFYVLLSHIATVGSMSTGWFLTFIHAVGRVTPLLLLAILAVLGVDALSYLMKKREALTRATAWGVVGVGAFILCFGLLGHDWYVYSGLHSILELVTQEASFVTQYANQFGGIAHSHGLPEGKWLGFGNWLFVTLIVIPIAWNWYKRKKETPKDNPETVRAMKWFGAYTLILCMFLYLLFSVTIPHWYKYQVVPATSHHGHEMGSGETDDHAHTPGTPTDHEHTPGMDMTSIVEVRMNAPAQVSLNRSTQLEFQVIDKATSQSITNLEISHGEPMHLVGVRKEDMGQFFHIHPQVRGDRFVVNHTFTQPGTYLMWAGIVYGGMHMNQPMTALVVGTPPTITTPQDMNRQLRLENDLVVTLKSAPQLHAGMAHQLGFAVTDAGGFDVPLGDYLEENMHINIVSEDGTFYSHLHTNYGMIGTDSHGGDHAHSAIPSGFSLIPIAQAQSDGHTDHSHGSTENVAVNEDALFNEKDLRVQLTFPKPGKYKVFGEFVTRDNPNQVRLAQ